MLSAEPKNCHLWGKSDLTPEDIRLMQVFDLIETIHKDTHDMRYIVSCKSCNAHFLYDFHEEIDWQGGNDPQDVMIIPANSAQEARVLAKKSRGELSGMRPMIHSSWPSHKDHPSITWLQ